MAYKNANAYFNSIMITELTAFSFRRVAMNGQIVFENKNLLNIRTKLN